MSSYTRRFTVGLVAVLATLILCTIPNSRCAAFSSAAPRTSYIGSKTSSPQPVGNILILDHLNMNHEKGRHDWLKAFYFDFLKCAVDPRKMENLDRGEKTLWANIGANQFHLPEGKPSAQVLQGVVTLVYPDLSVLQARFSEPEIKQKLQGSKFAMDVQADGALLVTDPWGTSFRLVAGAEDEKDPRGSQSGDSSEGLAIRDLTLYAPADSNLMGISRFYKEILGAPILEAGDEKCVISVGPKQTLTFIPDPEGRSSVSHDDMRDDEVVPPEGYPSFLSNYGPHLSIYVANLPECYNKALDLGVAYVNARFKRRAYNLEQAVDECMFRCLDIVDPENKEKGAILRLEHEVRSVVKKDGTKYKSCPFDEIPDCCKSF